MKKKIIVFGIMTIVLMIGTLFCRICYVRYQEKIKLTYIGSAVGECPYFEDENGLINPEKWKEKKYVYCGCQSYRIFKKEDHIKAFSEKCNLKYNFEFTFRDGHRYVCAYGYPLKALEYLDKEITHLGTFYNRAKIDKDSFNEGVWYFYEIEDINIGDMLDERELVGLEDMY